MARLSSLITAAVSVCSDVGEGNLKHIMEPFEGEKATDLDSKCGLISPPLFFLTVGPANSRSGVLAVET